MYRVPLIAVADAELKQKKEPPLVVSAGVAQLRALYETHSGNSLSEQTVLVIGANGNIGSALAGALLKEGCHVVVYDSAGAAREPSGDAGERITSCDDLLRALKHLPRGSVVVAATGEQSIGQAALLAAPTETYFASLSSKRVEVDAAAVEQVQRDKTSAEWGTEVVTHYGRHLYFLNDMLPINFHGRSESVPDNSLQFVSAMMLWGTVALARESLAPGVHDIDCDFQEWIAQMQQAMGDLSPVTAGPPAEAPVASQAQDCADRDASLCINENGTLFLSAPLVLCPGEEVRLEVRPAFAPKPPLPLLHETVRKAQRDFGDEKPLSGLSFLIIQHALEDFKSLMTTLCLLGADPQRCTVVPVCYSARPPVLAWCAAQGFRVYDVPIPPFPQPVAPAVDRYVRQGLKQAVEQCREDDSELIVVEDGGYASTVLHADENLADAFSLCRGIVEQTRGGLRRFEREVGDTHNE